MKKPFIAVDNFLVVFALSATDFTCQNKYFYPQQEKNSLPLSLPYNGAITYAYYYEPYTYALFFYRQGLI